MIWHIKWKVKPPQKEVSWVVGICIYWKYEWHGADFECCQAHLLPESIMLPTYPRKIPQTSPFTPTIRKKFLQKILGETSFWYFWGGPCGWDLRQNCSKDILDSELMLMGLLSLVATDSSQAAHRAGARRGWRWLRGAKSGCLWGGAKPIASVYGIFTYIWLIFYGTYR